MTVDSLQPIIAKRSGVPPQPSAADDGTRVIVALHDGFYGTSSGTGFSNRAFLTVLARLLPVHRLTVLPAAVPSSRPHHDPYWAAEMRKILSAAHAEVIPLPVSTVSASDVDGREALCAAAGEQATEVAKRRGRSLLIGLDAPFLGLPKHTPRRVDILAVPRTSGALTNPGDRARRRWEKAGLQGTAARGGHVAVISSYMRHHLRCAYGVPDRTMLSLPNGLLLDEQPVPLHGPPLPGRARAGFLFAMGRAVPEKGFQDLLSALGLLRQYHVRLPHLVLAATDSGANCNSHQEELLRLVETTGTDATVITRFDPALRSWLRSPALRAVIVPSREEPFGRIPLEAFAAQAGPVVATGAGGLAQTVLDGVTGFSAAPGNPQSLAEAIHRALHLLPREREQLISAGNSLVATRHDYTAAIRTALTRCAPWALEIPQPDGAR